MKKEIKVRDALVEAKDGTFDLTEDFKKDIESCDRPKIIMVFGPTRAGKSTLLNNLILPKIGEFNINNIKNDKPFNADGGFERVTTGFQYYGPMDSSTLCKNNKIKKKYENEKIIFIDAEGTDGFQKESVNIFRCTLALSQICDIIIFTSHGFPDDSKIKTLNKFLLINQFVKMKVGRFTQFVEVLSNRNSLPKELEQLEKSDDKQKMNELIKEKIEKSRNKMSKEIQKLLIEHSDLIVQFDGEKAINYYWESISKCVENILNAKNDKLNGKETIKKFNEINEFLEKSEFGQMTKDPENNDMDVIFTNFISFIAKDIFENNPECLLDTCLIYLIKKKIIDETCKDYEKNWDKIVTSVNEFVDKTFNEKLNSFKRTNSKMFDLIVKGNNFRTEKFLDMLKKHCENTYSSFVRCRRLKIISGILVTGLGTAIAILLTQL